MISKTKIKQRKRKKTNSELVETIEAAIKNPAWEKIAAILSGSRQTYSVININEIEKKTTAGDTVVVPGKVLSEGTLTKKVRVCAVSFSKEAREKIKNAKGDALSILEEIRKNAKAEGVKVIR